MTVLEEYDFVITTFLSTRKGINEIIEDSINSRLVRLLVVILRMDIFQYREMANQIDLSSLNQNSNEYFIFLESKIAYLCISRYKEKRFDFSKERVDELITLCNQALHINPNAYVASTQLAFLMENKLNDFSGAISLLENIVNYGFSSSQIASDLLYLYILTKNWQRAEEILANLDPISNKLLAFIAVKFDRYPAFLLIIILTILFIGLFHIGIFVYIGLMFLYMLIMVLGLLYKNRVIQKFSITQILVILGGFLFVFFGKMFS